VRIGVVFPQSEIGTDPGGIREFAQAVEAMGYTHILAADHVVGANTANTLGRSTAYDLGSAFHEPFVLFGYLAGVTTTIEFTTGILILPQRQTVLVAKQAAALDVLSGGRLRLGVGIGWNEVEYTALNENFKNRGRRSEEQIETMRALWTQDAVTVDGQWHQITDAGLNPLPIQRPIPIYMGGGVDVAFRRIAKIGDGWMPSAYPGKWRPDEIGQKQLDTLRHYTRELGRDPDKIGLDGRVSGQLSAADNWMNDVASWREIGATHIGVDTGADGLVGPEQHIRRLEWYARTIGL